MKPCGRWGAFFLAAAVSDFYMPWSRMVRHLVDEDCSLQAGRPAGMWYVYWSRMMSCCQRCQQHLWQQHIMHNHRPVVLGLKLPFLVPALLCQCHVAIGTVTHCCTIQPVGFGLVTLCRLDNTDGAVKHCSPSHTVAEARIGPALPEHMAVPTG